MLTPKYNIVDGFVVFQKEPWRQPFQLRVPPGKKVGLLAQLDYNIEMMSRVGGTPFDDHVKVLKDVKADVEGMFTVTPPTGDTPGYTLTRVSDGEFVYLGKSEDINESLDIVEDSLAAWAGFYESEGKHDAAHALNEKVNLVREYREWLEVTGWKD